jgi:hypothetical protein
MREPDRASPQTVTWCLNATGMPADDGSEDFRLDRTEFSVARLADPDNAVGYWLSRPVEERLRALEFLRRDLLWLY